MVTFAVYILLRSRTSGPEITEAKMSCWIQSRSITLQSRARSKISQLENSLIAQIRHLLWRYRANLIKKPFDL